MDINGTKLEFDSNGNPNIGYDLVELTWKNSTLEFLKIGNFNKILNINMSLFQWHTKNSEVIFASYQYNDDLRNYNQNIIVVLMLNFRAFLL